MVQVDFFEILKSREQGRESQFEFALPKNIYKRLLRLGYSRKNPHPHDGRHGFLTPPPTWISKTAQAPLLLGFPS